MTAAPPPAPPPDSSEALEAAFYDAVQQADLDRLMACWADEDDVFCVQPGGPRLIGPAAIRLAFETLFARASVRISAQRLRIHSSPGLAVHSVLERLELGTGEGVQQAWTVATNVYAHTMHGWRLVARHSSPADDDVAEISASPKTLH